MAGHPFWSGLCWRIIWRTSWQIERGPTKRAPVLTWRQGEFWEKKNKRKKKFYITVLVWPSDVPECPPNLASLRDVDQEERTQGTRPSKMEIENEIRIELNCEVWIYSCFNLRIDSLLHEQDIKLSELLPDSFYARLDKAGVDSDIHKH